MASPGPKISADIFGPVRRKDAPGTVTVERQIDVTGNSPPMYKAHVDEIMLGESEKVLDPSILTALWKRGHFLNNHARTYLDTTGLLNDTQYSLKRYTINWLLQQQSTHESGEQD